MNADASNIYELLTMRVDEVRQWARSNGMGPDSTPRGREMWAEKFGRNTKASIIAGVLGVSLEKQLEEAREELTALQANHGVLLAVRQASHSRHEEEMAAREVELRQREEAFEEQSQALEQLQERLLPLSSASRAPLFLGLFPGGQIPWLVGMGTWDWAEGLVAGAAPAFYSASHRRCGRVPSKSSLRRCRYVRDAELQ